MSGSNPISDADGRRLVLIVDDEPNVRTVIRATIRMKPDHYRAIEAGNASDALHLASQEQPNVVLLDVALPDHDGFWVCRQLKGNAATAQIQVIMLTAMGLPADRERAMQAGADGYIVKPFSPRALLAELDQRLLVAEEPDLNTGK
jgi:DNA-binding response OmpR family regulator